MRWVVVCALAGCFSTPTLNGGVDGDGGIADGATADGSDGSMGNCTWRRIGTVLHDETSWERHPWLSSDARTLVFWRAPFGNTTSNAGLLFQANRPTAGDPWDSPFQIYPATGTSGAPDGADPSLDHAMTKMYLKTNAGLQVMSRANANAQFSTTPTSDTQLSSVSSVGMVQDGGFLTDDGLRFLFVAGPSANFYPNADLYIASRPNQSSAFGTPVAFEHNVAGKNECCPTMAGNLLMYERPVPAGTGETEIVQSVQTSGTFSAPTVVVLPGTDSFQQPSLSADGNHLVYVVNRSIVDWHLEEAVRECP